MIVLNDNGVIKCFDTSSVELLLQKFPKYKDCKIKEFVNFKFSKHGADAKFYHADTLVALEDSVLLERGIIEPDICGEYFDIETGDQVIIHEGNKNLFLDTKNLNFPNLDKLTKEKPTDLETQIFRASKTKAKSNMPTAQGAWVEDATKKAKVENTKKIQDLKSELNKLITDNNNLVGRGKPISQDNLDRINQIDIELDNLTNEAV